jgi:hypothetical protein
MTDSHAEVWKGAVTLQQCVFSFFKNKAIELRHQRRKLSKDEFYAELLKDPEFLAIHNFYGRQEIERLYSEKKNDG